MLQEGYCSLYLHLPRDTKAAETHGCHALQVPFEVSRTLFVGRARHGPTEADCIKNCGVSEMCVLSNQIDKETGSVVVGGPVKVVAFGARRGGAADPQLTRGGGAEDQAAVGMRGQSCRAKSAAVQVGLVSMGCSGWKRAGVPLLKALGSCDHGHHAEFRAASGSFWFAKVIRSHCPFVRPQGLSNGSIMTLRACPKHRPCHAFGIRQQHLIGQKEGFCCAFITSKSFRPGFNGCRECAKGCFWLGRHYMAGCLAWVTEGPR